MSVKLGNVRRMDGLRRKDSAPILNYVILDVIHAGMLLCCAYCPSFFIKIKNLWNEVMTQHRSTGTPNALFDRSRERIFGPLSISSPAQQPAI